MKARRVLKLMCKRVAIPLSGHRRLPAQLPDRAWIKKALVCLFPQLIRAVLARCFRQNSVSDSNAKGGCEAFDLDLAGSFIAITVFEAERYHLNHRAVGQRSVDDVLSVNDRSEIRVHTRGPVDLATQLRVGSVANAEVKSDGLMNVTVQFLFAAIIPNIAAFPRFGRNCS